MTDHDNKLYRNLGMAADSLIGYAMDITMAPPQEEASDSTVSDLIDKIYGCGCTMLESLVEIVLSFNGSVTDNSEKYTRENLSNKLKRMHMDEKLEVARRVKGVLLALAFDENSGPIQEWNNAVIKFEEYHRRRNRRMRV